VSELGPIDVEELRDALPGNLWEKIQEDPARAPEHIALAAAKRFAPAAERFAVEHAGRPPDVVARHAVKSHVRWARLEGAALGIGGALTAVPDIAALAWLQSRMVFFIAAAHGFDPHDPMRPAELLALQGFYETPEEARAGLDGLAKPLAVSYIESRLQREEAIFGRLARILGKQVAKRAASRMIPFLAAPLSSIQNARGTSELGRRAITYYGG